MYNELYQYFILNQELQLPGIGTFLLERKPAEVDFANRQVSAPAYSVALHHGGTSQPQKLYQWLASSFRIGEEEAVAQFNEFVSDLRSSVLAGGKMEWNGIGVLSRGLAGEIRFEPTHVKTFSPAIPASKVLRENAEHLVRVGEQERSSVEMIGILQPAEARRNWAWVLVVTLLVAAVIFIGYYFSEHGVSSISTGNQNRVKPAPAVNSHRAIP